MRTKAVSELESFHRFLDEYLSNGGASLTPEESVEAFRAHERDLERLKEGIRPAVERFKRGGHEARELDYEKIEEEVTQRLAAEGITD